MITSTGHVKIGDFGMSAKTRTYFLNKINRNSTNIKNGDIKQIGINQILIVLLLLS
jgi:hypothetical protein